MRTKDTVGKRIREQRRELNMTQEQLAEILCSKKNTISDYENDNIDIKISVLMEIAQALNTSVASLTPSNAAEVEDPWIEEMMGLMRLIHSEDTKNILLKQMKALV